LLSCDHAAAKFETELKQRRGASQSENVPTPERGASTRRELLASKLAGGRITKAEHDQLIAADHLGTVLDDEVAHFHGNKTPHHPIRLNGRERSPSLQLLLQKLQEGKISQQEHDTLVVADHLGEILNEELRNGGQLVVEPAGGLQRKRGENIRNWKEPPQIEDQEPQQQASQAPPPVPALVQSDPFHPYALYVLTAVVALLLALIWG
jgi:hypothetical protein